MDEGGVCTRRREKEKEIKTATTTTTTSGDEGIPVGISVKYPGIDKARTRSHPSKLLYPSFSCSPRIFYPPRILTSVPSATTNKGSAFSSAKMMRARSNHLPLPPDSTSPTALPPSILHVSREPPSPSLLRPLSSPACTLCRSDTFSSLFYRHIPATARISARYTTLHTLSRKLVGAFANFIPLPTTPSPIPARLSFQGLLVVLFSVGIQSSSPFFRLLSDSWHRDTCIDTWRRIADKGIDDTSAGERDLSLEFRVESRPFVFLSLLAVSRIKCRELAFTNTKWKVLSERFWKSDFESRIQNLS